MQAPCKIRALRALKFENPLTLGKNPLGCNASLASPFWKVSMAWLNTLTNIHNTHDIADGFGSLDVSELNLATTLSLGVVFQNEHGSLHLAIL